MILPLNIPSPDLQSFQVGIFTIQIYTLCLLIGIIAAWLWTSKRLTRRGGEPGVALDFAVWAVLLGILGARLYHVATHISDYVGEGKNFWEIFAIWNGGIAIFGALIGGGVGVFIASRLSGVRFWSFADALVPGLLLGQTIGRFGNWFNHELFGGPTTLPWGLEIESTNPAFPVGLPDGTLFHPTFLYEIIWNFVGIVLLLAIERKFQPRWGKFFGMYLIWYGIGRFWVESLRVDPSLVVLGLRTNELAALLIAVLGLAIIIVQHHRHPGREASVYLPGRRNPQLSIAERTADEERFYHVLGRSTTQSEADAPDAPIETDTPTRTA